jgi:hypothetical protein
MESDHWGSYRLWRWHIYQVQVQQHLPVSKYRREVDPHHLCDMKRIWLIQVLFQDLVYERTDEEMLALPPFISDVALDNSLL